MSVQMTARVDERVKFYEETKDMASKERVAHVKTEVAPIYEKFNIKRVSMKPVRIEYSEIHMDEKENRDPSGEPVAHNGHR